MRIHIALTLALAMILGTACPQAAARAAEEGSYAATIEEAASDVEAEEDVPAETGATAEEPSPVTEEEILDYYAIGQCTPGIIAVNTATFVGRERKQILTNVNGNGSRRTVSTAIKLQARRQATPSSCLSPDSVSMMVFSSVLSKAYTGRRPSTLATPLRHTVWNSVSLMST